MIQLRSRVEVADNTGAKSAMMIRRLGQNKKTAAVGDTVVVHIKDSSTDASVKKRGSCSCGCRKNKITHPSQ